jgi:hypothetical protein
MTKLFSLIALVLPILAVGCGDGLSNESATAECEELQQRLTQCLSEDATFSQCVTCFEECGVDCEVSEACPATFACP